MARFTIPEKRFPWSPVQIRTRLGLVDFVDHAVEVDDEDLAAALREVPNVFGIVEDEPPEQDGDGDGSGEGDGDGEGDEPERPSVRAPKAEWVAYAANHPDEAKRITEAEADGLTKAELIEMFGG